LRCLLCDRKCKNCCGSDVYNAIEIGIERRKERVRYTGEDGKQRRGRVEDTTEKDRDIKRERKREKDRQAGRQEKERESH
jgi:hypothetical protein